MTTCSCYCVMCREVTANYTRRVQNVLITTCNKCGVCKSMQLSEHEIEESVGNSWDELQRGRLADIR